LRLTAVGAYGQYGFYEALATLAHVASQRALVVRAFMAHHQGMTVVAIANVLFDGRMRARFHAEASVRATELLLQERTPRDVSIAHPRAEEVATAARMGSTDLPAVRRLHTPHTTTPQTHLLSNGRYAVMLTGAGSGYSRWREQGVTRWREDATRDDAGSYIYLRDVADGMVWSAGYQPSGAEPDNYEVAFTEDRAEFHRSDGTLTTTLHVVVSTEDDAEVRRASITTAVMTRARSMSLHTANWCWRHRLRTTHIGIFKIVCANRICGQTRRTGYTPATLPASADLAGASCGREGEASRTEYETDRARFLGRGREVNDAIAVMDGRHCPIPLVLCSIQSLHCAIGCGFRRALRYACLSDQRG
jgi:cyclic beta-1,2-glucan synthetase